jgi:hypothetical protein
MDPVCLHNHRPVAGGRRVGDVGTALVSGLEVVKQVLWKNRWRLWSSLCPTGARKWRVRIVRAAALRGRYRWTNKSF